MGACAPLTISKKYNKTLTVIQNKGDDMPSPSEAMSRTRLSGAAYKVLTTYNGRVPIIMY